LFQQVQVKEPDSDSQERDLFLSDNPLIFLERLSLSQVPLEQQFSIFFGHEVGKQVWQEELEVGDLNLVVL
jgi:hypothetical protein